MATTARKLFYWEDFESPVSYPLSVCALDSVRDVVDRFVFTEAATFPDEASLVEYLRQKRAVS